jgi:hypothetical protein
MNEITRESLELQRAELEAQKEELIRSANQQIAFLNGKQDMIDDLLKVLPASVVTPAKNGHRAAKVVESGN